MARLNIVKPIFERKTKKLSLQKSLEYSLSKIENALECEVVGVERVIKLYGSNANSFFIKILNKSNRLDTYFLKFSRSSNIDKEIAGTLLLQDELPTPKIILASNDKLFQYDWALFEHINGQLMSEKLLSIKSVNETNEFLIDEFKKENILCKMHQSNSTTIDYDGYLKTRTNKLFHGRLFGQRFDDFYLPDESNISSVFKYDIILNGRELNTSVNQIFQNIRQKYDSNKKLIVPAILGHGDAHHGNIIINDDIWFIDNEYADFIPPLMELSKPYYNDFIGTLFFHHHDNLYKYFRIKRFDVYENKLLIDVDMIHRLDLLLEIARIKLEGRKELVNKSTLDFLDLNDYLVLCHTLTKNPNLYPKEARYLFVAVTAILANFDAFNPETFYDYLKY